MRDHKQFKLACAEYGLGKQAVIAYRQHNKHLSYEEAMIELSKHYKRIDNILEKVQNKKVTRLAVHLYIKNHPDKSDSDIIIFYKEKYSCGITLKELCRNNKVSYDKVRNYKSDHKCSNIEAVNGVKDIEEKRRKRIEAELNY